MISRFVRDNHISAIGETGLHYTQYNAYGHVREWQEELFRKHLDLAEDIGRMVIVHSLGSFSQALRVLKDYKLTVILHYPLGSYPVSKKTRRLIKTSVERGYYFSIAPKDRFGSLEEVSHLVAREVPKNRLLVESDGPRRKKIEPAVVVKIVDKICHDMKVSEDEAKKILYTNAMKLLEKQI